MHKPRGLDHDYPFYSPRGRRKNGCHTENGSITAITAHRTIPDITVGLYGHLTLTLTSTNETDTIITRLIE